MRFLVALLFLGAACGKSPCGEGTTMENGRCVPVCGPGTIVLDGQCVSLEAAKDRANSVLIKEFEKIRDEMCRCRGKKCAELVNVKFEEWLVENEQAKGSKEQQEQAKEIAEEYTTCMISAWGTE